MNNRIEYRPFEWVPNDFSLKGTDEKFYTLEQFRGSKGLVVMFICNHCPYVKAVTKDIVEDCNELKKIGINSVAICANDAENYPEDSFDNMIGFAKKNHFGFPYLNDETQKIAKTSAQQLEQEINAAREKLKSEVAAMSLLCAEKIISKEITYIIICDFNTTNIPATIINITKELFKKFLNH